MARPCLRPAILSGLYVPFSIDICQWHRAPLVQRAIAGGGSYEARNMGGAKGLETHMPALQHDVMHDE
jgi:hypothetical protein